MHTLSGKLADLPWGDEALALLARIVYARKHDGAECPPQRIPKVAELVAWKWTPDEDRTIRGEIAALLWDVARVLGDSGEPFGAVKFVIDDGRFLAGFDLDFATEEPIARGTDPDTGEPTAQYEWDLTPAAEAIERISTPGGSAALLAVLIDDGSDVLAADVFSLWSQCRPEVRPRCPLAPLVAAWQRLAPVQVDVDRRPRAILAEPLRAARRQHADQLPLGLDLETPMGPSAGEQGYLPGLAPAPSALVPVLPLALYDLAGGAMQSPGRGAPLAQRLFFEVLMSVGRLDRVPGQTARVESTYRELVAWLWPNLRRRTWDRSRHLPALYRALLELDGMRIEWERQLWRLVAVTALPTGATRPDDPAVFRVEHLPGSDHGPLIDRALLRRFGLVSAPAWRAFLRLAYLWDHAKAKNGGRRIYATRPKVQRDRDGVLIDRDGRPVQRRDGRPVRDWSDSRAVQLYGSSGELLSERNPAADRVPLLGPDDLVRLAFDGDLPTGAAFRKRVQRAHEALAVMEAAGAVVVEDNDHGLRLLEPPRADVSPSPVTG